MVDINNVELNVGDKVVFAYATSGYLYKGEIVKFTKQGLAIKRVQDRYVKDSLGAYNLVPTDIITNLIGANQRVMKL